jgi:hypothetical protein
MNERIVLKQLLRDLRDDWFPDPRRSIDLLDGEHLKNTVKANLIANKGLYEAGDRTILNVPKPNFTLRYGLETSVSDRAVYHALASYLIPFFDPLMPWNVFSHRHNPNSKKRYIFQHAISAWSDFTGVVQAASKSQRTLLSTDLTNYFENINLEKLRATFAELIEEIKVDQDKKNEILKHIDLLFRCLTKWCYSSISGLPQNRDASSFLANIYMLPVDKAMLAKGYQYFRYMDDIKIACEDKFVARRALKDLGLELRKLGLSVNSGKTAIIDSDDAGQVDESLDAGGEEFRQIASIWNTRSLSSILRSIPMLRALTIKVLEAKKVNSREFRYCIRRLEALATCVEFTVPPEYFEPITLLVIEMIPLHPAATDQFVRYLQAVNTTSAQLDSISEYLIDSKKSTYTWQNYRLWVLLVQKKYASSDLMCHARTVVEAGIDDANRHGASLYLGAMGSDSDRQLIAENFANVLSYLGQRIALIAVHELPYDPIVKEYIQPALRADLKGVFKSLKRKVQYVAPAEKISITTILDVERDYE